MKVSKKFSLEIKESDFNKFATSLVEKSELKKAKQAELKECLEGIFEGTYGGVSIDWKQQFYLQLYKRGVILQTQKGIEEFGDFSEFS